MLVGLFDMVRMRRVAGPVSSDPGQSTKSDESINGKVTVNSQQNHDIGRTMETRERTTFDFELNQGQIIIPTLPRLLPN